MTETPLPTRPGPLPSSSPRAWPEPAAEVEAALYARDAAASGRASTALAIGLATGAASLIVSIAQLAQAILSDRRNHNDRSSPDSITRQVRISLREHEVPVPAGTDRITDVVATEIIRLSADPEQPDTEQPPRTAG